MHKDKFWDHVDCQGEDECWCWTASRLPSGYGRVRFEKKSTYAHRVAWILTHGPIPEGMVVCHHCDNPPCCNPKHLFVGTQADNVHDRDRKGRGIGGRIYCELKKPEVRDFPDDMIGYPDWWPEDKKKEPTIGLPLSKTGS